MAGLVTLRSDVAPGTCGEPVVDHVMNVRGDIIAGTDYTPVNPILSPIPAVHGAPRAGWKTRQQFQPIPSDNYPGCRVDTARHRLSRPSTGILCRRWL